MTADDEYCKTKKKSHKKRSELEPQNKIDALETDVADSKSLELGKSKRLKKKKRENVENIILTPMVSDNTDSVSGVLKKKKERAKKSENSEQHSDSSERKDLVLTDDYTGKDECLGDQEVFNVHPDTSASKNDKKKHKKRKRDSDMADSCITDIDPGSASVAEKENTKKKPKVVTELEHISEKLTNNAEDSVSKSSKKKKHKHKSESLCTLTSKSSTNTTEVKEKKKKKEKLRNKSDAEVLERDETQVHLAIISEVSDVKYKKKHKKSLKCDQNSSEETPPTPINCSVDYSTKSRKRKKREDKPPCEVTKLDASLYPEESDKHSNKNKSLNSDTSLLFDISDATLDKKKHRKKLKIENGNGSCLQKDPEHLEEINVLTVKKKNSKKEKSESKKSKSKQALNESKQDTTQQTQDNDAVNTGKSLSAEVSLQHSLEVKGQWQGQLFGNAERQNKFLRLLGGAKNSSKNNLTALGQGGGESPVPKKKGLFGSLTLMGGANPESRGGATALSIGAAASLDQKLEEEYNRAMNFKVSGKRGAGFGFMADPAEGKKFHIDISKSKSVKFDD